MVKIFLRFLAGVNCYNRWVLSGGHKITSRIGISWTHSLHFCFNLFLTQWMMAILSERCKPDKCESINNSLKLSFVNSTLCERRTSFCTGLISRKLCDFYICFQPALLHSQCLTSFSSINHLLYWYARFSIYFFDSLDQPICKYVSFWRL